MNKWSTNNKEVPVREATNMVAWSNFFLHPWSFPTVKIHPFTIRCRTCRAFVYTNAISPSPSPWVHYHDHKFPLSKFHAFHLHQEHLLQSSPQWLELGWCGETLDEHGIMQLFPTSFGLLRGSTGILAVVSRDNLLCVFFVTWVRVNGCYLFSTHEQGGYQ